MADPESSLNATENVISLYRAYLEATSAGIIVHGSDGRVLDINPAACSMHGYSRDEMLALDPKEFVAPESHTEFDAFMRALAQGEPFRTEARERRKDGTLFDVDVKGERISIGGHDYYFATLIDITARRVAEERVRDDVRYRALVAELSSTLLRADAQNADRTVEGALARVADVYDVDFCGIWWLDEAHRRSVLTHLWAGPAAAAAAELHPRVLKIGDTTWATEQIINDKAVRIETPLDFPAEAQQLRERNSEFGVTSELLVPMHVDEMVVGALMMGTCQRERRWSDRVVEEVQALGEIIVSSYWRLEHYRRLVEREGELSEALEELESLRQQIEHENRYLRDEIKLAHGFGRVVGRSAALQQTLRLVERVARTDATVLISGETGTGKELLAQMIHDSSAREGPLVSINCAALPPTLIESELFGHEKGAFTGAHARKLGRLELAARGTLFLDEIGDLPLQMQAKLLRALQESQFERVGGTETLEFTGRVVAATNRDLEEAVAAGEFRDDLFFRLNVFPLIAPPLRDRVEDVPMLAQHFADKHGHAMGREIEGISPRMLDYMKARDWPGNIRELESFVQRELITGDGPVLDLSTPPPDRSQTEHSSEVTWPELEVVERDYIRQVLDRTGWKVEGDEGAARVLGMPPSTLRSRMKKLGVTRDPRQPAWRADFS